MIRFIALLAPLLFHSISVMAEEFKHEQFDQASQSEWRYVADTVMGGVSDGQMVVTTENDETFARITGKVSTENNGGFIQMRKPLDRPVPDHIQGIKLLVRGNEEAYFIHLRTKNGRRPWYYYSAEFFAPSDWAEVTLPFNQFNASRGLQDTNLKPEDITAVGVVAYGRDHTALLDVKQVKFY